MLQSDSASIKSKKANKMNQKITADVLGFTPEKTLSIKVYVKNNYGNKNVYPKCSKATLFAKLAGTKTLTPDTLGLITKLGYDISIVSEELSINDLIGPNAL